jgi:hypothetical protein
MPGAHLGLGDGPGILDRYQEFWTRLGGELPQIRKSWSQAIAYRKSSAASGGSLDFYVPTDAPAICIDEAPLDPRNPQGPSCDICVQFDQTVRRAPPGGGATDFELIHSVVCIAYVRRAAAKGNDGRSRQGRRSPIIAGLHFDLSFDLTTVFQKAHPMYHAQLDFGCISDQAIGRPCHTGHRQIHTKFPRIPTAPLDLPAVMFLVLNDHFPEIVVDGWPAGLRSAVEKLPQLPDWPVSQELRRRKRIDVDSWYGNPARPPTRG